MKDPKWRSLIVLAAAGLACGAAAAKGPAGVSSHVRRVGQDAQWAEIQGLLSKCVGVYASPGRLYPNFTPDGPFMGNGDMHVALLGGPHRQVFHISKSDMWTDDRNICPITFGGVTISPDANTDITAFRQEHDILNAEVRATSAAGFKTKSFVANENVLLTELWTDGSVGIPMHVDVWARADRPQYPAKAGVDGAARILWVTRETCGGPKARWVTRAALAVAIEGVSITTRTDGLGKNTASFTLKPGKKATLYTVLAGGKDATTHLKDAKAKVVTLNAPKAAALRAGQLAWWKEFWLRSYVVLNDADLEKYYYGGLYQTACVQREGSIAVGQYPFCITDSPVAAQRSLRPPLGSPEELLDAAIPCGKLYYEQR